MKKFLLLSIISIGFANAQNGYWQQHADYKMDVSMDVKTYRYKGNQQLVYTNNSPDTLRQVFYHLYNNAFQPGSEMDMRLQHIPDPDGRMVNKKLFNGKDFKESRIKTLKPDEIGYLKPTNLKQDGTSVNSTLHGTVLRVALAKPILPGQKTTLTMDFEGQVPVQIRRSGRNNKEGVELSMAQWYPKLAEYDFEGWHADAYIAREFHGVWGNFDVKITIDKDYTIGSTGYLQNANEIGHGYQDTGITIDHKKKKTLTWHFVAPNVHDFTWAADTNYLHDVVKVPNGATLHFLYKNNPKIIDTWKAVQPLTVRIMEFYNEVVGKYPYEHYSIIQGGDGGMEYAMCTLILGEGKLDGMTGLIAHEMGHSWFQQVLASNESSHGWMDEGFTTFIEDLVMNELAEKKSANPFEGSTRGYVSLANSGKEQPLSTHADRFDENRVYSIASYSKGSVFLSQLVYLIGFENTLKTLKKFYTDFKFKHPTPNDITRTAEKVSGAQLGWYLTDWTRTTNTIDYSVSEIKADGENTSVSLKRIGRMPMPVDLLVEYADGTAESFYIPLRMMYFEKENPYAQISRTVLPEWTWGNPDYTVTIKKPLKNIKSVTIDPSGLMADVKREDNTKKP